MNQTLKYYQEQGESFFKQTAHLDMTHLYEPFLKALRSGKELLDFGCGSGRDAAYFQKKGYLVQALDGSEEMCRLARENFGIEAQYLRFEQFDQVDCYDGIWACSSLLHVPKKDLSGIMQKIIQALRKDGVLYASFKYGDFDGLRNGRHFSDFNEESLSEFLKDFPQIRIEQIWITQDVRRENKRQKFINVLLRKV